MRKNILVVVAHADDEVLGCGATIAKHKRDKDLVHLIVLTESTSSQDGKSIKKRREELDKSSKILNIDSVTMLTFKDNQLDRYPLLEIIKKSQEVIGKNQYDIVYTHSSNDLNVDHRIVNQLVLTLFRPLPNLRTPNIFSFDIPSSVEYQSSLIQRSSKNYFNTISDEDLNIKKNALSAYASEIKSFPHPRSTECIELHAKLEGSKCGLQIAESFYIERIIN
ncbi:PIG-L deacetylase family protein [Halobacteriovorax sp. ZH4_bin.1]|uniref:PIG-L deacetylase family protein n=1 Tax=unclassified Halobacteriovorax TaxID=2639665 RepID=UPI00371ED745